MTLPYITLRRSTLLICLIRTHSTRKADVFLEFRTDAAARLLQQPQRCRDGCIRVHVPDSLLSKGVSEIDADPVITGGSVRL